MNDIYLKVWCIWCSLKYGWFFGCNTDVLFAKTISQLLILERSFSVILDARSDAKRQVSIYHLPSGLFVRKELVIIINITLILLFVPNAAKNQRDYLQVWNVHPLTLVAVEPHWLKLPRNTKKWFELERVWVSCLYITEKVGQGWSDLVWGTRGRGVWVSSVWVSGVFYCKFLSHRATNIQL